MAVRNLYFEVAADSISPSQRVISGVSGEDNATHIYFLIDESLKDALLADAGNGGKLCYRFEAQDVSANGVITEPAELSDTDSIAEFKLTESFTRDGGNCSVCLVLTAIDASQKTKTVFRSLAAKLYLEPTVRVSLQNGESLEDITTLYDATKDYATKTENFYNSAKECLDECREISSSLDSLSDVAVSGDYNDLKNIPMVDNSVTDGSSNLITSNAVSVALAALARLYKNFVYDANYFVRPYAFHNNTDITEFEFSSFAKGVAEFAFLGTNVRSIVFPSGITTLRTQCFRNCRKLEEISLPATANKIDFNVFQGCSALKDVSVEQGFNCSLDLSGTKLLSRETVLKIINAYADNCGKSLTLNAVVYNTLTSEDLSAASSKGLTVISI